MVDKATMVHYHNNKKSAVISAQFNWVFVLIIGVIIFLFFVAIARNQKDVGTQKIEAETQMSLKNILSGQTVIEEGSSLISLNSPITLKNRDIKEIVFSPSEMESNLFVLQTKPVKNPFFITNAMYITNPDVYYVFVYYGEEDLDTLEYYYEEMPDKFMKGTNNEPVLACNKHLVEYNSEEYDDLIDDIENFKRKQKVRIIIMGNEVPTITNQNIEITNATLDSVEDYKLGYIFSDDEDEYYSVVERIEERKEVVERIYQKKLEYLIENIPIQNCKDSYDRMQGNIEEKSLNQNLQYLSCPVLY